MCAVMVCGSPRTREPPRHGRRQAHEANRVETLRARRRSYLANRLSRLELGSSKSGLHGDDSSILISRTIIATEWPVMKLSVQALRQGTKKGLAVPAHGQQTKRLGYGSTSITCAVERAITVRLTALQHSVSPFCFKPRYCMRTTVSCQAWPLGCKVCW